MRFAKVKDKVFDNGTSPKKTLIEEKAVIVASRALFPNLLAFWEQLIINLNKGPYIHWGSE